jgi:hypothetical protein
MATMPIEDLNCWEEGPPDTHQTLIYARLQSQLPFPHGVLLPQAGLSAQEFGALDQAHQDKIVKECPSGQLLDGLIMLVRALMACGINGRDKRVVADTRLYDMAPHRWGYRRFNDFAMKGHLFELLRGTVGGNGDYDPTMHDLLHHPLVVQTIWGHPCLSFFQQSTTVKNPATGEWEAAQPDFLSDAEQAARMPFRPSPEIDLAAYFASKMGTIVRGGREFVLASAFPDVIPIIMRGTRPFNDVRCFELEGPRWSPGPTPDTEVLKPKYFARYVVALVLNMSNGDARHYHESTRAICESLVVAPGEIEQHKHARAESNATWNFEAPESGGFDFLFLYRRVPDYGGKIGVRPAPYTLPTHTPISTRSGEYVDPTKVGTLFGVYPRQGMMKKNPMAVYAMSGTASQASGSPWGSMVADASERSE